MVSDQHFRLFPRGQNDADSRSDRGPLTETLLFHVARPESLRRPGGGNLSSRQHRRGGSASRVPGRASCAGGGRAARRAARAREAQDAEAAAQEEHDSYIRALAEVDARLRTKRGRLHPLRRLPAEVLAEIFLAYLAAEAVLHTDGSEEQWHHAYRAPDTVAQVSRHWRRVALDTPRLWRYISVEFLQNLDAMTEDWMSSLEGRIACSGALPVRLLIRGPFPPYDDADVWDQYAQYGEEPPWTRDIWKPLIALVPRCQAVCIVIRKTKVDLSDMGPLLRGDAPLLEELTIRLSPLNNGEAHYHQDINPPSPPFNLAVRAPSLRRLELVGVMPKVLDPRDTVVYPRLTHAMITMNVDFDDKPIRALLVRLPALTHLETGSLYVFPDGDSLSWFAHPAVRHITPHSLSRLHAASGVGPATFPSLESADLSRAGDAGDPSTVLGPAGPFNALRRLTLKVGYCDAPLVRALDVLPRLEVVLLLGGVLTRSFVELDSWASGPGGAWRCPRLAEVVLRGVREVQPVGPDAVLALLRERNASTAGGTAHAPFRRFCIDWETRPESFGLDFEEEISRLLGIS